jgi:oligogalacturonide lyase
MRSWIVATALVLSLGALQSQEKRDWIDPDTGHRIVRLDAAGGSTLYFHDNALSPEGDKLMFNTPDGITVVDVAKIGSADLKPEIVGHGPWRVLRAADTRDLFQQRRRRRPWPDHRCEYRYKADS